MFGKENIYLRFHKLGKETISQIPEVEKGNFISDSISLERKLYLRYHKLRKENIAQIPEVKKGKHISDTRS